MEYTRPTWTDGRLDDLSRRVDAGFAQVDAQFVRVDGQFTRVDGQFARVDAELRALRADMNSGFDALTRLLLQLAGGAVVTMVLTILSLVLTNG